ncbi:488b8e34-dc77-411d-9ee5-eb001deabe5d-CDS [Sclerotinia trifoliorum]|uniref:488b8e34-dc77-411d-9ee5-eb001deabe5d-CDS n=1 Tax=Sclerotinia trifoliorum TaxID=28548 RepID=A0A8H2ZQB7_9HELO|nr:488b8e34-dc77-411d-9ee5-eb001deabe5d-CDS [Sclerotinia trifoliorum]
MQVLYGENQFLIECVKGDWNRDVHYTALTRYIERLRFYSKTQLSSNRLGLTPGLKCVKHWKVLIAPLRRNMRIKLIEFCRSICHNQVKSIEVAIITVRDKIDLGDKDIIETTWFKRERSNILKYLEQRGIFDPTCVNDLFFDLNVHTEAISFLEEYAASFNRELDTTTKRAVRAQHGLFEPWYNSINSRMKKQGLIFPRVLRTRVLQTEKRFAITARIVKESNLIDMEICDVNMAGWISLPFYDQDDCFSSIYQMDDNQFHLTSTHTAAAGYR